MSRTKTGRVKYSGLWPTSTNAACGFFVPVKVLSSVGRAATTSGHQGFCVCGSLEARKAMKKALAEGGIARSPIFLGRVKGWRIGIVLAFPVIEEIEGCGVSVYGERRE